MRNMFEIYGDGLQLDDLHSQPSNTFSSAPDQLSVSEATSGSQAGSSEGQPSGQVQAEGPSSDGEQDQDGSTTPSSSGSESDEAEGRDLKWGQGGWLKTNPLNCPTEREHYVQQQGLPVYRVLLRKPCQA
jgi:hypothetical protein